MKRDEKLLKCDWCGIEERVASMCVTSVKWVRMEVFQLVHAEAAATWDLCAHCWSVVEARRCGIRSSAIGAGRIDKPEGSPLPVVETGTQI